MESRVEATHAFYPLYGWVGLSFLIQLTFLLFFKKLHSSSLVVGSLFFFETLFITGLIYLIGIQQSLLVFLYLVNLILCGVLFQRRGALKLALWTSVLFSFLVSLDESLSGSMVYLAVGVNNLAFFTAAYLAGILSEQLNIMGDRLKDRSRDLAFLKNLNELILNNINSGVITVDKRGLLLQANPSAQSILKAPREGLLSSDLETLFPGLERKKRPQGQEFELQVRRGGESRLLRLSLSPLQDGEGQDLGQILSFQDQTHLRVLEKKLRQSEKMAAIGQLAAGIAHEIRNPLAGISGSVQLLQAGPVDKEQNSKLMSIIGREIDRLNHLITEFLDFAKPEAPMEDKIEVGSLLKDTAQFLKQDSHLEDLHMEFDLEPGVQVLGNRDKLRQVFLNIILNALQAMDSMTHPRLCLKVKKQGNQVFISIKDWGMGMTEEIKERIFEPFHTTKQKGTGLGLAITHSIIQAHGGEVVVETGKGQGTEFRLQLKALL